MLLSWVRGFYGHILWQFLKGWFFFLSMGALFWFLPEIVRTLLGEAPTERAQNIFAYHWLVVLGSFVFSIISLEMSGAWLRKYRVKPYEDVELQKEIRDMARGAGLGKTPILAVLPGPMNAAATSSLFSDSVVISMGHITDVLRPRARRGVFGHETAHIKHWDIFAQVIIQAGNRALWWQSYALLGSILLGVVLLGSRGFPELWYIVKAWLVTQAVQFLYSLCTLAHTRAREYLADMGALKILGVDYREDLVEGLLAVGITMTRKHPLRLMRRSGWDIFMSHPELADRAEALGVEVKPVGPIKVAIVGTPVE